MAAPSRLPAASSDVLDILFERMPMGIAILDGSLRLRRCNPTFADFMVRGTPFTPADVTPGVGIFDIDAKIEGTVRPLLLRALAGETVRLDGAALIDRDPHWYWDLVFAPLAGEDGPEVLMVGTDVTERAHAQQELERRVEERTRELEARQRVAEAMRDVLLALNSGRGLTDILDYIVEQATRLLGAGAAALFRLERDGSWISLQAATGLPVEYGELTEGPVSGSPLAQAVIAQRRPIGMSDLPSRVAGQVDGMPPLQRQLAEFVARSYRSGLVSPLIVKDELWGGLVLYYADRREVSEEHLALALSFCNHAALAIDNARLHEQAQEAAAVRERQRLARDLHDSVTQTLFSATLIAEVLPALWERNPAEGQQRLEDLRQLSRGAMAEMRSLLFELRPDALAAAPLPELLGQLVEASTGRARLPIVLETRVEGTLPSDVHGALYRIAQEALNNVVRHSGAQQAKVTLQASPRRAELRIEDDGKGFAPARVGGGHLGLGIMRERAQGVGARLRVRSKPGAGAEVVASWRAR